MNYDNDVLHNRVSWDKDVLCDVDMFKNDVATIDKENIDFDTIVINYYNNDDQTRLVLDGQVKSPFLECARPGGPSFS